MGKPRIAEIEAAIIAAIQNAEALSYVPDDQVQTLSQRTINFESEELLVVPPGVLVHYAGGAYDSRDIGHHLYSIDERFLLIAVGENRRGQSEAKLGGPTDEEHGIYDLLDDLKTLFGGAQLTVNATAKVYCRFLNTEFQGINPEGHMAYALGLACGGNWSNV